MLESRFPALTGRLRCYFDTCYVLVLKEFHTRYKRTWLGYAWSVLSPLGLALVFFFLFRIVMRIEIKNYSLFLLAGLFPWHAFQNSLFSGISSFVGNAVLIKKSAFPRSALVIASVITEYIHLLLTVPILLAFMFYYGQFPHISMVWTAPLLLILAVMTASGLSLIAATLNLFFRDLERLLQVFLMFWFYGTPILFESRLVPEKYQWAMKVNPMAYQAACWHDIFYYGRPANGGVLAITAVFALASLTLGWLFYRRCRWQLAEVI
jgi:lipopolysaccharide transport system permease protein